MPERYFSLEIVKVDNASDESHSPQNNPIKPVIRGIQAQMATVFCSIFRSICGFLNTRTVQAPHANSYFHDIRAVSEKSEAVLRKSMLSNNGLEFLLHQDGKSSPEVFFGGIARRRISSLMHLSMTKRVSFVDLS